MEASAEVSGVAVAAFQQRLRYRRRDFAVVVMGLDWSVKIVDVLVDLGETR